MTTLLLSTPDGISGDLLDHFQSNLLDIVRSNRSIPSDGEVQNLGRDLAIMHDKILGDQQKTWFQLNEHDLADHRREQLVKRIETFKDRLPRGGNCVIHDPTMILFVPLWRQVLNSPALLFYYSEPMETALNLRDSWRFPIYVGLALWEYYVCQALNLLPDAEHMLVSSRKLCQDPAGHLTQLATWLESLIPLKTAPDEAGAMAHTLQLNPVDDAQDGEMYLNEAQKRLYSELESGQVSRDEHRISAQSRDILFHYGNLRAGFEGVKKECRTLTLALRRARSTEEETMLEQPASELLLEPDTNDDLLDVVVHIKHMEPLVFSALLDSPVLEMLYSALQAPAADASNIIFLKYGAGESDALYFPVGSLLAVDTTGLTSH